MKKNLKWRGLPPAMRKIVLVMKLSLILVLVGTLQLSANVLLGQQVSISTSESSLRSVLEDLQEQTGTYFMYHEADLNEDLLIELDLQNATLENVLDEICKQAPVEYEIIEDFVLLKKRAPEVKQPVQEEKNKVKGKVTDDKGIPLPGVSVVIKGTNIGVATNIDGEYTLEFDQKEAVLIFSFVGMLSQEIAYAGQAVQNVTLTADSEQMAEVVVTGYQTISKERATGSFTILNEETIDKKLNNAVTDILEGQVAGLEIDKEGNLTIRGKSTFSANQTPLVVVDGFPIEGGLESVSPDNIENITFLKDAVTASIYGARSNNGVVVVTTKTAKKGERKITYTGSYGIHFQPDLHDSFFPSTSEYIEAEQYLMENFGNNYSLYKDYYMWNVSELADMYINKGKGLIDQGQIDSRIEELKKYDILDQLEDYVMRSKTVQKHNLLISSGTEFNKFNFNLNYNGSKNYMKEDDENRYILDLKNTTKINDLMDLNIIGSLYYTKGERPIDNIANFLSYSPTGLISPYSMLKDPVTGENANVYGLNSHRKTQYESYGLLSGEYSPLDELRMKTIKEEELKARVQGNLVFNINKDIKFSVGGSFTKGYSVVKKEYDGDSFFIRTLHNNSMNLSDPQKHLIPKGDAINESRNTYYDYTVRSQIDFNKTIGKHRISFLAGFEERKSVHDYNNVGYRFGYNDISGNFAVVDDATIISGSVPTLARIGLTSQDFGSFTYFDSRFRSYYSNASYTFDDKYLLSGSFRIDQSNLWGVDPKYKNTPLWSIGGTYKISREKFFDVPFIDNLDIRGSYGINGNVAKDNGPNLIVDASYYSPALGGDAARIVSPPNDQLRWEKTYSTNLGFDVRFLKRFSLTGDFYFKRSVDLLAKDNIDPTYGFLTITKNVGEVENKGIELSLRANLIDTDKFSWNSGLIFYRNKSKITSSNQNLRYPVQYQETWGPLVEGYDVNALWVAKFARIDETGGVLYYNQNGDEVTPSELQGDDMVYGGTLVPKYTLSWNNNFSYKNFDLDFTIIYKGGHKMRRPAFGGSTPNHKDMANRWRKAGDELTTNIPKLDLYASHAWYYNMADINAIDASYCKLRNVTLSYKFPTSICEKLRLSAAKAYVQGRNLITWTANDDDIDPESREITAGYSTIPGYKVMPEIHVGLSVSF